MALLNGVVTRWLGITNDESTIDLGQLKWFLDGDEIRFKTDSSSTLYLDAATYPDSMPTAVGRAVLALREARLRIEILEADLNHNNDLWNSAIKMIAAYSEMFEAKGFKNLC